MLFTVRRESTTPCCAGSWEIDGVRLCASLERPWNDNKRSKSSIPAGRYELKFTWSPRFKRETLEVLRVPNRTAIRIHPANDWEELAGCLTAGIEWDGPERVTGSRTAIRAIEAKAAQAFQRGETVHLEILDPKGAV